MTERDKPLPLLVKLCSDRAAFEAVPQRRVFFDMNMVRQLFDAIETFEILVYTPSIIIIRSSEGREVTFSRDGRMLLKKILNEDEATALAQGVLEIVSRAIKPK